MSDDKEGRKMQRRQRNKDSMRESRAGETDDKKIEDRDKDAARAKERRAGQTEDKKIEYRQRNALLQKQKRGTTYADHREDVEARLKRFQKEPPTSEQLLIHEQRAITTLFMYYHRCGCDNIMPAEEFAELE